MRSRRRASLSPVFAENGSQRGAEAVSEPFAEMIMYSVFRSPARIPHAESTRKGLRAATPSEKRYTLSAGLSGGQHGPKRERHRARRRSRLRSYRVSFAGRAHWGAQARLRPVERIAPPVERDAPEPSERRATSAARFGRKRCRAYRISGLIQGLRDSGARQQYVWIIRYSGSHWTVARCAEDGSSLQAVVLVCRPESGENGQKLVFVRPLKGLIKAYVA